MALDHQDLRPSALGHYAFGPLVIGHSSLDNTAHIPWAPEPLGLQLLCPETL